MRTLVRECDRCGKEDSIDMSTGLCPKCMREDEHGSLYSYGSWQNNPNSKKFKEEMKKTIKLAKKIQRKIKKEDKLKKAWGSVI